MDAAIEDVYKHIAMAPSDLGRITDGELEKSKSKGFGKK